MVDNNPLVPLGLDIRDVKFIQLFIIWLMSLEKQELTKQQQILSVQNFKNAAHYDLKTVNITMPGSKSKPMADEGVEILKQMIDFFSEQFGEDYKEILEFQMDKLLNPEHRYSWIVRKEYQEDYVVRGLQLAEKYQKYYL